MTDRLTDSEVKRVAGAIATMLLREYLRVDDGPMRELLGECWRIANLVECGEYHRDRIYFRAVECLGMLGVDTTFAKLEKSPYSKDVNEAARNARCDTFSLWSLASRSNGTKDIVAEVAFCVDEMMTDLIFGPGSLEAYSARLHDAITDYIGASKVREQPSRIVQPALYSKYGPDDIDCDLMARLYSGDDVRGAR